MTKQFSDRFKEWQNYVHYFLLASSLGAISTYLVQGDYVYWWANTWRFFISVFIADSLIHYLFWNLPRKLKWRD